MLTGFPKGFGFDPTVMGESSVGYIAGRSRLARLQADPRRTRLPVVLVADELLPVDPQQEADAAPSGSGTQSPFLATALVGLLLASVGYFMGFN
jgi:hypothetical protein